ncbi:hypothetical protein RJT34_01648 [Clitoria ternatea]|uniref:Uncharacterized protein n=1 Tax=Clitoria ternatea TaxID=43366 RepID=A0AAN9KJ67_CLITE
MESSSTPRPRFCFRDHTLHESRNSSEPTSDVVSNVSLSMAEADAELDSMTARGIKHLCDELRELKEAANEDLHKNIFAKYSTFLRGITEDVTRVQNEVVQLQSHFVAHKRLVKDLIDNIYPMILSINLAIEDHMDIASSPHCELEEEGTKDFHPKKPIAIFLASDMDFKEAPCD